ncbi:hypothetical protein HY025_00995 [Candidatus Daviesbacteria bacterium]|nr:hypothetical protein [Candidatus Daviesbacteria bacterium]
MKRLVLIDGNALLHRAYHATPPLTTKAGELVNGVYGFTSMLLRSITDLKPDFIGIAWDKKAPTFRHQVYTQYKATRGPVDDGLSSQYKRVHEVVDALNIPEFELAGFEADDLIGTLATQAVKKEKNIEVIVVTGDRDIMQIIDKNIKILMPKKTLQDVGLYGEGEFFLRFGFEPKQIIDYKALAGDQSDNIPGVAGIGEVTATKLIKQFGSVEKIYIKENLASLPERTKTLLAEGAESAVLSKKLATLDLNAPIKLNLAKCVVSDYDQAKAIKLFEELQFKSLISRLPGIAQGPAASVSQVRPRLLTSKTAVDARDLAPSVPPLKTSVTQNQATTNLDLEVEKVLQKMSKVGILIDLKFLDSFGKDLKVKLAKTEKEIYKYIGHEFNLNSPKQLSEVLFDELHLPVFRKTKTGRSTDEATLNELSAAHPAVSLILEYRQLFKLISTYVDTLPKYVDKQSLKANAFKKARIHSTFNVEGAATGRLSSQDPNLQNIPVKGTLGGELRKAFIAPKNKILLGADYSQIELRIMAHLADDPGLKKAFQEGLDIHSATAAKIFKVPVEKISKEQRLVGKTMNFATLYGQGPRALSQQLKVDFQTARQLIAEYFEQFPKVREWMQKTLEFGMKEGYVQTLWGRKRFIPELQASNKMIQSAGERMAVNMPVQGTCADMIKKAMVEIDKNLKGEGCVMILQVHDELLFECDGLASSAKVLEIAKLICDKMENAIKLSVPIKVDLKVGKNWGEMERLSL